MLHNSLQGRDLAEAHPSSAITYGGASVEIELDALHTNLDSLTNTVLPTKMDKVGGATGKIAIFKADGNIESSGINSTNVATDIDVSEEDGTVSIQLQNVGTGIGTIRQFNKSSIGLSDVVNTGDSDTPTEGGTTKFTTGGAYTELNKKADKTTTINGHTLGADVTVSASDVGLGSVVNTGDSDTPVENGTTKFTTGGAYTALSGKADKSTTINGHSLSENVTVTQSDVGLGNVDNTSDLNKPISTATQSALNGKSNATNITNGTGTKSLKQIDENDYNTATGAHAIALGSSSIQCPDPTLSDEDIIADWEVRELQKYQLAKGENSFSSGNNNLALGINSHAEGNGTVASNNSAHSEGTGSRATGKYSHAGGRESVASGDHSFAHGAEPQASGDAAVAFGYHSNASGKESFAEGRNTVASANQAHAEGQATEAVASQTHAEGYKTRAQGGESHAEGGYTLASGDDSHAEGRGAANSDPDAQSNPYKYYNTASGAYSHVGGFKSKATGEASFAHGNVVVASGKRSVAMGDGVTASGDYSVALGNESESTGKGAFAAGSLNHANAKYATALGSYVNITHENSCGFGTGLISGASNQVLLGSYNTTDGSAKVVIGCGTSSSPKNALTVNQSGAITVNSEINSNGELTFRNSLNIPVTLTQIIYGLGLGCIVKGTQITMADGTKKAVEDIKVGDEVLGYDIENDMQVPTVVIFNMPRKPATICRLNMFEDGSTLKTVDEHYVFNVNGSYCSDITKWEVCDAVLKQDGTTSNFVGYFLESDSGFENYNILTSNNTYYANEMLNSCWPPSKFHYCDEFNIEMPDELYNSIEQELQYHRHGAYNVDNPEFLEAVAELEKQETEINKNIRKQKAYLAATDYQPIKTTEKIINAILTSSDYAEFKDKTQDIYDTDLAEKIARRAAARQSIVDTEELSASLGRQITALKEQYGVITPFDKLSHREQFKICNRIGNENIDKYRAWEWITSHKSSK